MKLNKLAFAKVIAHCVGNGFSAGDWEVERLDELIDFEVPVPDVMPTVNPLDIDYLMALMAEGTRRIEAIKCHRKITGYGLKESKDTVEKYWVSKPIEKASEPATLGDILGHAVPK
jgi:hypothetical protein